MKIKHLVLSVLTFALIGMTVTVNGQVPPVPTNSGPQFIGVTPFTGNFYSDPNWWNLVNGIHQAASCDFNDHTNYGGTPSAVLAPTLGYSEVIYTSIPNAYIGSGSSIVYVPYTVRFWYKGTWDNGNALTMQLGNQVYSSIYSGSSTWKQATYFSVIQVTNTPLTISFDFKHSAGSSQGVKIDAVQVIPNYPTAVNTNLGNFYLTSTKTNTCVLWWNPVTYANYWPMYATDVKGPYQYLVYNGEIGSNGFFYAVVENPGGTTKMFYRLQK